MDEGIWRCPRDREGEVRIDKEPPILSEDICN